MSALTRMTENIPRSAKRMLAMALDLVLCVLTVQLAYWLRLSDWIYPTDNQWLPYLLAPILALPIFISVGLYRAIFRFSGWSTLKSLTKGIMIYAAIYAAIFTAYSFSGVPRTIGLIQPLLLLFFVGGSRATARTILGLYHPLYSRLGQRRAIIFGAGSAGRQLEAALQRTHEMEVVAFIDDHRSLQGSELHGKTIHSASNLPDLLERYGVTDFLLAIPSASRQRRKEVIDSLSGYPVKIRTVPSVVDIASGRVKVNELRELQIEELLGRDTVPSEPELMARNIGGKTVLVTGAGGSIGSELCRQIARLGPQRLILVEVSEFNLYSIHQELDNFYGDELKIVPLLGSVLNETRMDRIVVEWRPDTIYHAAAYKHVPLVECNIAEGLLNNVVGTMTMALVAERQGVSNFVLISTDKAVRPTNVMGATKRLAEQVLQARAAESSRTCFSMVRFGNVLGSSGSVVPLFRSQIQGGGPVTITHAEITRYFMTIPEASQLVIQAGAMAHGGEVFVLDMGEPVKVVDIARRMINLMGLTERTLEHPDGDIAIEVVGLRPGEKLYEELLIGNNPEPTQHRLIMKAREDFIPWDGLSSLIAQTRAAAENGDELKLLGLLKQLVPEYAPEAAGEVGTPQSQPSWRVA
ncbi:MAG: polysaccharide biosynthesis protein [Sphingorhabdus sp.]